MYLGLIGLVLVSLTCLAAQPPLEAFARSPAISSVSISDDGRYLAYVTEVADQRRVIVLDRLGERKSQVVLTASRAEGVDVSWCKWANDRRLLCGLFGTLTGSNRGTMARTPRRNVAFMATRLMAVNADGTKIKQLMDVGVYSQFQDRIIDWTPQDPQHVLIEVDHNRDVHPSVFELDVDTGKLTSKVGGQHSVINRFWSDGAGEVRLGRGTVDSVTMWYARSAGATQWVRLSKFETFADANPLVPLAIEPGADSFYFRAKHQGRDAIWRRDLQGDAEATLAYSDASADLHEPIFSGSGRLIGFSYADKSGALYIDARAKSVSAAADKLLPQLRNIILTSTPDQKVYLLRSSSDQAGGQYSILDTGEQPAQYKHVGSEYPELERLAQQRVEPITYPARTGSSMSAYLFRPPGTQQTKLPLVVLPRGGPMSRDPQQFFFLRNFLVSRGYAVLYLSFPDASGYEWEWFKGAHQDWGGLTYQDVVDGTQWAMDQEGVDARRACIIGWGFGGYLAQLSAIKEKSLFRCAASIAGVSDVLEFKEHWRAFLENPLIRERIGSDVEKLRADSPAGHAAAASIPILLIHGDRDWQVPVTQSQEMARALERAGKPHEIIIIKDGNHQLRWPSERVTLLQEIERFLQRHLDSAS